MVSSNLSSYKTILEMTEKLIKKPTQCDKVLEVLRSANGNWVSGRFFLREMYLSQYHARIWELQDKGHRIEPSEEKDEFGFVRYRLLPSDTLF